MLCRIGSKPAYNPLCHFFIDAAILLKAKSPTDPRIVWLVPYAPVPVTYHLTPPLFDAAPDNIAAARGEPAHCTRVVRRPRELGEGEHGYGADVEYGLDIGGKYMPVRYRIRRVFIKQKDADD